MKDLLIVLGAGFVLYAAYHQKQHTATTSQPAGSTTKAVSQLTQNSNVTLNYGGGGGGGGEIDNGGGGSIYYGSRFDAARAAWDFAAWVDSIQLGGYPQITGVIQAPQEQ
jgi:hypothetical protein